MLQDGGAGGALLKAAAAAAVAGGENCAAPLCTRDAVDGPWCSVRKR
jgi:hypothetical protein